jgi:hypothetical protein
MHSIPEFKDFSPCVLRNAHSETIHLLFCLQYVSPNYFFGMGIKLQSLVVFLCEAHGVKGER